MGKMEKGLPKEERKFLTLYKTKYKQQEKLVSLPTVRATSYFIEKSMDLGFHTEISRI